jgi:uracil phosphoribosyltransferase
MQASIAMSQSTLFRGTQIVTHTSFSRRPNPTISPSLPRRQRHLQISAAAPKMAPQTMLVYVPPHPLVAHWVAVMRNAASPSPIFRSAAAELGRILLYEAVREWLPTLQGQVDTPVGTADVTFVDPTKPVKVVPVLRAGLVLLENAATVLPASQTFHVGYARDEETLESTCYLNKLPEKLSKDDLVLVSDCMLATGRL